MSDLRARLRAAWQGRISGCQLGKPVELISMTQGPAEPAAYLERAGALPLRDYVPCIAGSAVEGAGAASCRGRLERAEPDDDINYSVLALMMLEAHGAALTTEAVARTWLRELPLGWVFTAERAAYQVLAARAHEWFAMGAPPGFDLAACSDNAYSDWIGAQIRADVYGWVCPGRPELAARLAREDAALSHREDGVFGAMFIAALGAAIPEAASLDAAVDAALATIPADSGAAKAVVLGRSLVADAQAGERVRAHYADMSPVHTLNNLCLVVWSLLRHADDFGAAIGEVVTAGLDTDCNGATVGGLWGLQGEPIPAAWTEPWRERVGVTLASAGEQRLDDLVERTARVAERIVADA